MDVSHSVLESAAFTRATLAGRWSRWLILVVLGLPWMLLSSLVESSRILEGTIIHWKLIPWDEAGLLIGAGLLCNFLISGYIVRLLEGTPAPPEFDRGTVLFLDGIKVHVIPLVWILVPSVLAFVQYAISTGQLLPASEWGATPGTIVILVLLLIQLVILFIALQYVVIGAIRFSRTGSVAEAYNVMAIKATVSRIGIVNYFVALGIITFVGLLFSFGLHALSLVPFVGGFLALGLWPPVVVYCVRFVSHFCDEEMAPLGKKTVMDRGARALSRVAALGMIPEILTWLVILAVLSLLSFTPMVLMVASITGLFPG